jgi:hypothetical protein
MPSGAPFAKIRATMLDLSRGQIAILDLRGKKSRSPSLSQPQRRASLATITAELNSKSP